MNPLSLLLRYKFIRNSSTYADAIYTRDERSNSLIYEINRKFFSLDVQSGGIFSILDLLLNFLSSRVLNYLNCPLYTVPFFAQLQKLPSSVTRVNRILPNTEYRAAACRESRNARYFIIYRCNIQAREKATTSLCTVLVRRFYGSRRIVGFSSGLYFSSSGRSIFTTLANCERSITDITFSSFFSPRRYAGRAIRRSY